MPQLNVFGISETAPVQARHHKEQADQNMGPMQILEVKEIKPLAKHLRFMVDLNPKTLPRMQPAQARLERFNKIVIRRHGTKWFCVACFDADKWATRRLSFCIYIYS